MPSLNRRALLGTLELGNSSADQGHSGPFGSRPQIVVERSERKTLYDRQIEVSRGLGDQ